MSHYGGASVVHNVRFSPRLQVYS